MCTRSTPSASRKWRDRAERRHHRVAAEVITDPEAGEFQDQGNGSARRRLGRMPRKLRQPVTPGPEPVQETAARGASLAPGTGTVVVAQSTLRSADFRARSGSVSVGHACHLAMTALDDDPSGQFGSSPRVRLARQERNRIHHPRRGWRRPAESAVGLVDAFGEQPPARDAVVQTVR